MSTVKNNVVEGRATQSPQEHRGWRWVMWIALIAVAGASGGGRSDAEESGAHPEGPGDRNPEHPLQQPVELDDLQVSLIKGLAVSGNGLRIFAPDDVVAAGAKDPLIAVRQFEFHAGLIGLFLKPTHVQRGARAGAGDQYSAAVDAAARRAKSRHGGKIKILVDELVCRRFATYHRHR